MNIFLLVTSMLVVIAIEVPRLVQKKYWRELGAFFVILFSSYTLAVLYILDIIK